MGCKRLFHQYRICVPKLFKPLQAGYMCRRRTCNYIDIGTEIAHRLLCALKDGKWNIPPPTDTGNLAPHFPEQSGMNFSHEAITFNKALLSLILHGTSSNIK